MKAGGRQATYPVQCSVCSAWIWNRQARRTADDPWSWEHRSSRMCSNAEGTAPAPPQQGSEWLHHLGLWSTDVVAEFDRLAAEFRQLGLCAWCGDQLGGADASRHGLHAQCVLSTAEPTALRLQRLRSLHLLLHSEAG